MADQSKARRRWLWKNGFRKCAYCGLRLYRRGKHKLTCDHVVPVSAGGTHRRRNLVAACERCNQRKGSMGAAAFMDFLRRAIGHPLTPHTD